jgi:hypothetical protein
LALEADTPVLLRVGVAALTFRISSMTSCKDSIGCKDTIDGQTVVDAAPFVVVVTKQQQFQDPPSRSKLALPYSSLEYIYNNMRPALSQRQQTATDLCIIAWFYLLRVGEYTKPRKQSTQTTPIRVCDITFWFNESKLDPTLPLTILLHRCTAATIHLDNQKNGKRNATITQQTTNTAVCPVKALIRRVIHIRQHTTNSQTLIGTYFIPTRPTGWMVTATDINNTLKTAIKAQGLERFNISPADISSHSLRAGGANSLPLVSELIVDYCNSAHCFFSKQG